MADLFDDGFEDFDEFPDDDPIPEFQIDTTGMEAEIEQTYDPAPGFVIDATGMEQPTTRLVAEQGLKADPKFEAEMLELSEAFSTPVEIVRANPDVYRTASKLDDLDLEGLETEAPTIAQYLYDSEYNPIVANDVNILREIERTFEGVGGTLAVMGGQVGELTKGYAVAQAEEMERLTRLSQDELLDPLMRALGFDNPDRSEDRAKFQSEVAEHRENFIERIKTDNETIKSLTPEALNIWQEGVRGAAISLPLTLMAALTSVGTKSPLTGISLMGMYAGSDGYAQGLAEGMSNEEALIYGTIKGLIEAGTEMPVLKQFTDYMLPGAEDVLKREGAQGFMDFFKKYMWADIKGEQIAQAANSAVDYIAGMDEELERLVAVGDTDGVIDTLLRRQAVAAISATASSVTMTTGAGAVKKIELALTSEEAQNLARTQEQAQSIDKLAELARDSKISQSSEKVFNQIIGRMADDKFIYMDSDAVQTYLEGNEGTDPVTELLQSHLDAVQDTGEQIAIPAAEWMSKIAASEHQKPLQDSMSFNPDILSVNAVNKERSEQRDYIQNLINEAQTKADDDIQRTEQQQRVFDDVRTQLENTGMHTPQESRVLAHVVSAWAETFAVEHGITIDEAMQINRFDIKGPRTDEKAGLESDLAEAQGRGAMLRQDGEQPRNLFVAHNLSASNVLAAQDLGGLAAPSIAVARSDISSFERYGEISLLADPELLNDPTFKTFDADIYSPRQPRAEYKLDNKVVRDLHNQIKDSLDGVDLVMPDPSVIENEGVEGLSRSPALQYHFLKTIGKAPALKKKKVAPVTSRIARFSGDVDSLMTNEKVIAAVTKHYADTFEQMLSVDVHRAERRKGWWFNEDGTIQESTLRDAVLAAVRYRDGNKIDVSKLHSDVVKKIGTKANEQAYREFVEQTFNDMVVDKKLFKGYSETTGARRYSPYTMQNVLREMTGKLQGGENFHYGAGSVRSVYANRLKKLKDVKASRDKIVTEEEMRKVKQDASDSVQTFMEEMKPLYKFDPDSFGYESDVGQALIEGRKGLNKAFDMTPEAWQKVADLGDYLSSLPTEYFESKAQRAVQFREFNTAVVPKGIDKRALQVLKDSGLKIKYYNPEAEGDRQRVISGQDRLLFQSVGADADGAVRVSEGLGPTSDGRVSPRIPTGKSPEFNHTKKHAKLGLNAVKKAEGFLEKLISKMEQYSTYRPSAGANTPEKKARRMITQMKNNLLWLYDQIPEEVREQSKLWYDGARKITDDFSTMYGLPDVSVAAAIATLSPKRDWFKNVSLAERAMNAWVNHQNTPWSDRMSETADRIFTKPEHEAMREMVRGKTLGEIQPGIKMDADAKDKTGKKTGETEYRELTEDELDVLRAMWIRVFSETYDAKGYRQITPDGRFMGWQMNKDGKTRTGVDSPSLPQLKSTVSVMRDPSFENISVQVGSAHKVRNFYNNIIAPNSTDGEATMDTHAIAAAWLKPLAAVDLEADQNFGTAGRHANSGLKGTYGINIEAYREAAKARGILPREMQSITWEAIRGLFTDSYKTPENKAHIDSIWNRYRAGKLSLEKARQEVLSHAGGINDPVWFADYSKDDGESWDSSYEGELHQLQLRGSDTGTVDGGVGSGTAGGTSGFQQSVDDSVRGYYDPDQSIIRLTQAADRSTFLHEFAHLMLESELKMGGKRAEAIKAWMSDHSVEVAEEAMDNRPGVSVSASDVDTYMIEGTTGDDAVDDAVRVAMHEQFARGFETYIMEGKAPTTALRDVFRTLARWVTKVYEQIKGNLNVNMDDDLREIYDRMLSAENHVELAKARARFGPLVTDAAMAGMTEEQYQKWKAQEEEEDQKDTDKAVETLRDKLIKEITRKTKKWWKERKDEYKDIFDDEVRNEKVNIARVALRTGNMKIDTRDLKMVMRDMGMSDKGGKGSDLAKLTGMHRKDAGVTVEIAAKYLNYDSPEALVDDLVNKPSMAADLDARAEAAMLDEYGDALSDAEIAKQADIIVSDEVRGKRILRELKMLGGRTIRKAPDSQVILELVLERIEKLTYKELAPEKYHRAEIKAAQEAAAAMERGEMDAAQDAKIKQLMNHHLYREARAARDEIDKGLKWVRRYQKKDVRKAIAKSRKGHLEQIENLLARFELRKSAKVDESQPSLRDWTLSMIEDQFENLMLSPMALDPTVQKHWKHMTLGEFRNLMDDFKNIEHVAKFNVKVDVLGQKLNVQDVVNMIMENLNIRRDAGKAKSRIPDAMSGVEPQSFITGLHNEMLKVPWLMRWADNNELGIAYNSIYQVIMEAERNASQMMQDIGAELKKVHDDLMKMHGDNYTREVTLPHWNGITLQRHQLVAVALNIGNEGNLRKLLLGYGLANDDSEVSIEHPAIRDVMDRMSNDEWDFVERVWELLDGMYPLMSDMIKRTGGIVPPRVVPVPFTLPDGRQMKGGYYPAINDPAQSAKGEENEAKADQKLDAMFSSVNTMMGVDAGARHERTGATYKIKLNLDVAGDHIMEMVHYITHYEPVMQVNRIITDDQFRDKIIEGFGREGYDQITKWLRHIANRGEDVKVRDQLDRMFNELRSGAVVAFLGFSFSTMTMQLAGLAAGASQVGTFRLLGSMARLPVSARGMWKKAMEQSSTMQDRMMAYDRDVFRMNKGIQKGAGYRFTNFLKNGVMLPIAMVQTYIVDLAIWHAAHDKEMARSGDEAAAARAADFAVKQVSGSGMPSDLTTIMRSSGAKSAFTMFMTPFSAFYNMTADINEHNWSTRIGKAAMLFAGTAALEMLLKGDWTDEEAEEEEKWETLVQKSVLVPVSGIPVARDAVSYAMDDTFGFSLTPLNSAVGGTVQGVNALFTAGLEELELVEDSGREITVRDFEKAFKIPLGMMGIPSGQMFKTIKAMEKDMDEGDVKFTEFLYGPEYEK